MGPPFRARVTAHAQLTVVHGASNVSPHHENGGAWCPDNLAPSLECEVLWDWPSGSVRGGSLSSVLYNGVGRGRVCTVRGRCAKRWEHQRSKPRCDLVAAGPQSAATGVAILIRVGPRPKMLSSQNGAEQHTPAPKQIRSPRKKTSRTCWQGQRGRFDGNHRWRMPFCRRCKKKERGQALGTPTGPEGFKARPRPALAQKPVLEHNRAGPGSEQRPKPKNR